MTEAAAAAGAGASPGEANVPLRVKGRLAVANNRFPFSIFDDFEIRIRDERVLFSFSFKKR